MSTQLARAGLRDGTRVSLHSIGPEDRACIARGFEQLSPQARESRFLRPMSRLDGATLDYLTAIDGHRHLAVGAHAGIHDDEQVGLARCVRLDDEPETAEIAVTVLDPWQRRGAARVLVTELARGADAVGIRCFRALFRYDNLGVARLLQGAGVPFVPDGGGMIRADIPLELILRAPPVSLAGPASA